MFSQLRILNKGSQGSALEPLDCAHFCSLLMEPRLPQLSSATKVVQVYNSTHHVVATQTGFGLQTLESAVRCLIH